MKMASRPASEHAVPRSAVPRSAVPRSVVRRSVWRWFPWGLIAALGAVVMVNMLLVYLAVETFPGSAGQDGFDLSNGYGRVLAGSARQAELGWRITVAAGADRRPSLHAVNRNGQELRPASLVVVAERPVGPAEATTLTFEPQQGSDFRAREALAPGQWQLSIRLTQDRQEYRQEFSATERLIVR